MENLDGIKRFTSGSQFEDRDPDKSFHRKIATLTLDNLIGTAIIEI